MVELIPFFAIVMYLLPFCVAAFRDHERAPAVLVLNLLAGWTVVGWWVALLWAVSGGERRPGRPRRAGP
ncbi:MAG: superinfection immunity protein [Myxococcota bacterium]